MSKIFISYSHLDKGMYEALKNALIDVGHYVISMESLPIGENLSKVLNTSFDSADAVVALITKNSLNSKHVLNEIAVAQAQIDAQESKLFLPVVVGEDIEIPNYLRDRYVEIVPNFIDHYLYKVVSSIVRAIEHKNAIIEEKNRVKTKQAEKLETSKTEFIREAEERLNKKEVSLKRSANIWYAIGYIALILGVIAAFILIEKGLSKEIETTIIILLSIKALIGVGLLVASSKYAFTLGKSYMNESLKNSDRLHAISFGKFYLQAYGEVVTPEDVKEVFQHWNIAKDSSFKEIGSQNFDPKIFETAIEIASVLTKNKSANKNT